MHFQGLDLNLLVALNALLTERSTTVAASRIHISQSGMSSALARLRLYFNDELLIMQGRQMVPTPLGAALTHPVRDLLQLVQTEILSQNIFTPAHAQRTLRIMASDYVSMVFLLDAIAKLRSQAPGILCEIVALNDNPIQALEAGQADLLIIPEQYLSPSHPKRTLFQDEYVCIVDRENDDFGDSLTQEQFLAAEKVVQRFGLTSVPAADVSEIERLNGRTGEIVVPNFNLIPHFIAGTRRVASCPRRFATLYADILPIRLLPSPISIPPLRESLQWHSRHEQDPLLLWVLMQIGSDQDEQHAEKIS